MQAYMNYYCWVVVFVAGGELLNENLTVFDVVEFASSLSGS